jgi:hypothetical protein
VVECVADFTEISVLIGLAGENLIERISFARRLPKVLKRIAARTSAPQIPATIRALGVDLSHKERVRIRHALGVKLGRYETSIERVTVRVREVDAPRGGIDMLCQIEAVLSGLPGVCCESRARSKKDAIRSALSGIERAVRRSVQSRRTKPVKPANGGALRAGD